MGLTAIEALNREDVVSSNRKPRVWLAGSPGWTSPPQDAVILRDDRLCTWRRGPDGLFHTADNRHHLSWANLHDAFDLVELAA